nr:hypothetical protein 1634Bnrm2_p143 [Cryptomonas sp.]
MIESNIVLILKNNFHLSVKCCIWDDSLNLEMLNYESRNKNLIRYYLLNFFRNGCIKYIHLTMCTIYSDKK